MNREEAPQRTPEGRPRKGRWILGLTLVLAGTVLTTLWYRTRVPGSDTVVTPGMTVFEIADALVTEIDYEMTNRHVTAERSNSSEDPFVIDVKDKDGRIVEHCQTGAAFAEVFHHLTSIQAKRGLSRSEVAAARRRYVEGLAKLRVRTATEIEPLEWEIAITAPPNQAVLALDKENGYELALSPEIFELLAMGCSRLSSTRTLSGHVTKQIP